MTLEEAIRARRSVRKFKPGKNLSTQQVRHCLELAHLAPNSSNMQLWEFIHISDPRLIQQVAGFCFGQSAASTAEELVVFVTRQDRYQIHAKKNLDFAVAEIQATSPKDRQASRIRRVEKYYEKMIPLLYRPGWLWGKLRKGVANVVGLFRPIYREVSQAEMKTVLHKTCALACENFMLAMTAQGYDTCPMEGFDSVRISKLLHLSPGAKITMIIGCGLRDEGGIYGAQYRVPFDEVYTLK